MAQAKTKYRITDDFIRNAPRPAKGNVIYYDDECRGFAVRLTPTGQPAFLVCYGSSLGGGSARRMVIGKWPASSGKVTASVIRDMRKLAQTYMNQVAAGRDPYAERMAEIDKRQAEATAREAARRREQAEPTINQLCDRFISEHLAQLRPATARKSELRIDRHLRGPWGERKAKDITAADVKALLTPFRKAGKRAELAHVLALVTALFNFAVEDDELPSITANPTQGLKKKWLTKADRVQPRDRALTTKREFRAFYLVTQLGIYKGEGDGNEKPMHADEAACLRLMMLTGCRPSEAAGLPWSEIDFHAKVWNKPANVEGRSKSRRADVVPLVDEAMAILAERRGNGSPFVFPAQRSKGEKPLTENRLAGALRSVGHRLARMGVAPFTPHDLRRTVTTGMFDIDVSEYIIKRTLNHSTKGVTDTHYNKSALMPQRRAALEAWVAYLDRTIRGIAPEAPSNVVPFRKAG